MPLVQRAQTQRHNIFIHSTFPCQWLLPTRQLLLTPVLVVKNKSLVKQMRERAKKRDDYHCHASWWLDDKSDPTVDRPSRIRVPCNALFVTVLGRQKCPSLLFVFVSSRAKAPVEIFGSACGCRTRTSKIRWHSSGFQYRIANFLCIPFLYCVSVIFLQ